MTQKPLAFLARDPAKHAESSSLTRIVGPFNRVEGDLEVRLSLHEGHVQAAYVTAPLYRGFETMLAGKAPEDALVIVPRICGICSVAQSHAAVQALRQLAGNEISRNARLAQCLVTACENLADHLTHFYLFFMPDFARPAYAQRPWYNEVAARFRAIQGSAVSDVLPARAQFLHLMGLMAGKWPHTLALQPGGTTRALGIAECTQILAIIRAFRRFLERYLFGDRLENVTAIRNLDDLEQWRRQHPCDFLLFLQIAEDLSLAHLGRSTDAFLSYGAYETATGWVFPPGFYHDQRVEPLEVEAIREHVAHTWCAGDTEAPLLAHTIPIADKPGAYSWCKAPRYHGQVVETGALARQVIAGQPLLREVVTRYGGSVFARVLARLWELALVVPLMEQWARELDPHAPWYQPVPLPQTGVGIGLVEAARGALGHWLRVESGRIVGYQIIAPTTWNFSPRDANGTPGAVEQALVGVAVPDDEDPPLLVQHIVRSFDPCMVCTVH